MDFPIQSLIDEEQVQTWVLEHFHPQGLGEKKGRDWECTSHLGEYAAKSRLPKK